MQQQMGGAGSMNMGGGMGIGMGGQFPSPGMPNWMNNNPTPNPAAAGGLDFSRLFANGKSDIFIFFLFSFFISFIFIYLSISLASYLLSVVFPIFHF